MLDMVWVGLVNGNAYALVALGFSLVIGVAGVINFAHGSVFAAGALVGWWAMERLHLPFVAAVLAAVVLTGLLGWLIDVVAIRPVSGKAPVAAVLSTIAVMIMLDSGLQMVFGPQIRRFSSGLPQSRLQVGGVAVGLIDVIILATSVALMVVLALFLRSTRLGRAIRATALDRDAAAQMGVPVRRVQSLVFVIASAMGGLAGVLVAAYFTSFGPQQGFQVGLAGLAAATLGGLGSLPGAVVGGLLLGLLEAVGVTLWGDAARQLVTFGVLLLVLWVRPQGLLGRRAVRSEPLTGTFFARAEPLRFTRWQVALLIVLAVLPGVPGLLQGYAVQIGIQVVAFALVSLSMVVIGGAAGQLSLGQAGPVAVGAYAAGLLMKHLGWPFPVALLAAGLLAAVVITLLTAPSWKLSGHYPGIATIATGAAISAVALVWTPLTGGGSGLSMIPAPEVFGIPLVETWQVYLLGLTILLASLALVHRLLGSRVGRAWRALRDDEVAARAAGLETPQYKSLAFGVGGFLAGLGGAFWSTQYGYIDPTIFSPQMSFQIVTIAVLGSMLTPFGAVLGALVLVGGLEVFRAANDVRLLAYGLVLLLLVRFRPQGLWTRSARPTWLRRRTAVAVEGAER